MIEDLLHRYDLHGYTQRELESLLGPPDTRKGFSQWDVIYVLGAERTGTLYFDDEALGFKFDAKGHVVKYGLSVN